MTEDGGAGFIGQAQTNTMRDGPLVIDLVTRARTGDKRSWDALVERYAPLIWSICCRYRLGRADAEGVRAGSARGLGTARGRLHA